jgi:hypothetical protein
VSKPRPKPNRVGKGRGMSRPTFDMTSEWMEVERRRYHEELRRERSHHRDDRDDQKSEDPNSNPQVRGRFFDASSVSAIRRPRRELLFELPRKEPKWPESARTALTAANA